MNAVLLPTVIGLLAVVALFLALRLWMFYLANRPYWVVVETHLETGVERLMPKRFGSFREARWAWLVAEAGNFWTHKYEIRRGGAR